MVRRRSLLLALACMGALHACMQPYSTPQPFAIETGGQAPDDTTGDETTGGTTAAASTGEPGTSTGAATATTGEGTTGTTGDATTDASTTGTTGEGTTGEDTTTGDPYDACMMSFEFGDECGECLCDKCLELQQACAADEGCTVIRACAVLFECAGLDCEGPCIGELWDYGGLWGPSGSLAVMLGQCATQKCGLYCKV